MNPSVQLETQRLTLVPHDLEDFPAMCRLWSSREVTRFTAGNRPLTDEETWQRLLRYGGLWSLLGFGYFTIKLKESGEFIGEAGLADFHRDIVPSLNGYAEAGWALAPDHWGNGYAREAISAILAWYIGSPGKRPVACMISPENAVSIRLARAIGFKPEAESEYNGRSCLLMKL